MIYDSDVRVESRTFPGVVYTLRKMSLRRRASVQQEVAESNRRFLELATRVDDSRAARKARGGIGAEQPTTEEKQNERQWENEANVLLDATLRPAALRIFLANVKGLTLDGSEVPTVEQIIDDAPEGMADEIYTAINQLLYLAPTEAGESQPPIISSAPEDGRTNDSSAIPVNASATGASVTVAAGSPSA